jgi:hypothetical protein
MTAPETYAIVRTFGGPPPKHTVAHGSWLEVMEHVPDSKVIRQKLTIINDAEHAKGTLLAIRDREKAVTAREDSVKAREDAVAEAEVALLQDAIRKLDAQMQKMDSLEARRIQVKLDALPDPDDPSQYPAPRLPAAISLNEEPSHADDT